MVTEVSLYRVQSEAFSFVVAAPTEFEAQIVANDWVLKKHGSRFVTRDWRVQLTRNVPAPTLIVTDYVDLEV